MKESGETRSWYADIAWKARREAREGGSGICNMVESCKSDLPSRTCCRHFEDVGDCDVWGGRVKVKLKDVRVLGYAGGRLELREAPWSDLVSQRGRSPADIVEITPASSSIKSESHQHMMSRWSQDEKILHTCHETDSSTQMTR